MNGNRTRDTSRIGRENRLAAPQHRGAKELHKTTGKAIEKASRPSVLRKPSASHARLELDVEGAASWQNCCNVGLKLKNGKRSQCKGYSCRFRIACGGADGEGHEHFSCHSRSG